jgi:hypothetical protein
VKYEYENVIRYYGKVQHRTEVSCRERMFSNIGVLWHLNRVYILGTIILLSAEEYENAFEKEVEMSYEILQWWAGTICVYSSAEFDYITCIAISRRMPS